MREGDLRDQVLDAPNVDNRLHIARKPQKPDESDPPIEPHDPYGPAQPVTGDADFVSADDFVVTRNAATEKRLTDCRRTREPSRSSVYDDDGGERLLPLQSCR
jgi:hypothetical protein